MKIVKPFLNPPQTPSAQNANQLPMLGMTIQKSDGILTKQSLPIEMRLKLWQKQKQNLSLLQDTQRVKDLFFSADPSQNQQAIEILRTMKNPNLSASLFLNWDYCDNS